MPLLPLDIPAGVYRNGTDYQSSGRWRDALIAATDYYALTDVTLGAAMTTYRQALRDVPAQAGFPNTVTWPTKP